MNTVSIPMLFSKQTAGELSVVMLLLAVHMYRPTTLQNTSKSFCASRNVSEKKVKRNGKLLEAERHAEFRCLNLC